MQSTTYEDYKYSMQDTSTLYIGAKYTLNEIIEEEEIAFKFRLIVEKYILPEANLEDTLDKHLYALDSKSFLVKIYKQLKAKVKVYMQEEKRSLFGGSKQEFVTKSMTVEQLVAMSPEEKAQKGVIVQELALSKLALMSF